MALENDEKVWYLHIGQTASDHERLQAEVSVFLAASGEILSIFSWGSTKIGQMAEARLSEIEMSKISSHLRNQKSEHKLTVK